MTKLPICFLLLVATVALGQKVEIGPGIQRPTLQGVYNLSFDASNNLVLTPKFGTPFKVPIDPNQVKGLGAKLGLKAMASELSGVLIRGKQLFNYADPGNMPGKYFNTAGDTIANALYTESNFIPVSPGMVLTASDKQYVTYYSKEQVALGVGASYNRPSNSFTVTANTYYIRITVANSLLTTFQLQVGSSIVGAPSYQLTLNGETRTALRAQRTALASKVLTRQLSGGKNLYNKNDTEGSKDNYYVTPAGVLTFASGYFVSGFIPVTPSGVYVANGSRQNVAYYDSLQVPLGTGAAFDRPANSFTVTAGTYYIRATLGTPKDAFMVEAGTTSSTTYIPYAVNLDVTTPQASTAMVTARQAKARAVQAVTTLNGVFVQGKNLFNKNAPDTIRYRYLDENNFLTYYATGMVSGFIPVKPATVYTPTNKQFVCFYDSAQIFISGLRYDRAALSVTTPAKCAFVRLTVIGDPALFQFEEGSTATTVYPYTYRPATNLTGKRIWLGGTSIPALGGYWELASEAVGATLINQAVPSSTIRKADKTGSWAGVPWQNVAYSLSMTLAEKRALISGWSTYSAVLGNSPPNVLTPADTVYFLNCSYERSLVPYLNGTYPMPDLFVLSHGYNDRFTSETIAEFDTVPATRNNRNYFLGASNYIIDIILSYNPRAKIALEGHYENQLDPRVALGQQTLATYWQFPLLKLWEKTGWGQQKVPGTQALWTTVPWSSYSSGADTAHDMSALRYWVPDNVHPHSDPSGKARNLLAGLVTTFLTELP
ncbi:hypothetical protein GO755_34760 [Spirosoma sp. HMF4905]|uniref:SGNH/GDSL hydrolase family protein n=1 Tax=Spirosoma arboris TaxID=2682092 RepID=A0A7K1SN58_9BACT|nr:hypothetical protein [Spirosoma arboris]MVM35235.1 hypothetical protein [Spirosoma arboris]